MRKLRELEDVLIRVESALAVVLVLLMLLMAGYNVVYRNVLVPLQQHWAHSGPPVEPEEPEAVAAEAEPSEAEPSEAADAKPSDEGGGGDFGGFGGGFDKSGAEGDAEVAEGGDDFGGFGGGFGEDSEDEDEEQDEPSDDETKEPAAPSDDLDGFGGGFGEDEEDADDEEPAKSDEGGDDFGGFGGGFGKDEPSGEPKESGGDDFGGFGGGFGDDAPSEPGDDGDEDEDDADEGEGEDDFGDLDDQFANLPSIDATPEAPVVEEGPQGGPPPPGSFAAWAVDFIDAIKVSWIDVFLRQLVIIVAFLGAMIATRRSKHINIDALSKVLPRPARRVVPILLNLVSVVVCLLLASAGWDLVEIGQEYPKELTPWAEEWKFQLMFPVGFGLMGVHFTVRLLESIVEGPPESEMVSASGSEVADAVDHEEDADDGPQEADADAEAEAVEADADPDPDSDEGPSEEEAADEDDSDADDEEEGR